MNIESPDCPVCDSNNVVVSIKDIDGAESGFPGLELHNVLSTTCDDCGETVFQLPSQAELFSRLCKNIALSKGKLSGSNFACLRRAMRKSGTDFAKSVGVTNVSVSRWENEQVDLPTYMSLLLRSLALLPRSIRNAVIETEQSARDTNLAVDLASTDIRAQRLGWGNLIPADFTIDDQNLPIVKRNKHAASANDPTIEWIEDVV